VELTWGPIQEDMDLQGMTVGEAFRFLRGHFGIPANVAALVDGAPADGQTLLAAGQCLEFVRGSGEKGFGRGG
jgi:hypothetical protein